MTALKKIARKIVPPIAFDIIKFVKLKKTFYGFKGNYIDWKTAAAQCTGWESNDILEKVSQSTLNVKKNLSFFERDGELVSSQNYNFPVLAFLLRCINHEELELNVIDFGGSFGSHYFRFKPFLNPAYELNWSVVEQQHYVEHANKNFKNAELKFYTSIKEALLDNKTNTFLSSGTIQYLEKPYEFINNLINDSFDYIILDRIFMIEHQSDRIVIQEVNPDLFYNASFPAWLFNETRFIKAFLNKYELVAEFKSEDPDNSIDKLRIYHKGFFLKKKIS